MNENLRRYMEELFRSAPQTAKATELKEELLINMNEKYEDLISKGISEPEAYKQVIQGIGDVDELISQIQNDPLDEYKMQIQRKKTSLVVSVSVALYILSLMVLILAEEFFGAEDYISVLLFFGIATIPTCLLIYHFMSRPKYKRKQDTIVEEFKEWKSYDQRRKSIVGGLTSILWTLTLCLYFIISFYFNSWAVSWIIFLIALVVNEIIHLCSRLIMTKYDVTDLSADRKKLRNSINELIWTLTIVIYFIISFCFKSWGVSWIIFLVAACVTSVVNMMFRLTSK